MVSSLRMKRIAADYTAKLISLQKHRHNLEKQERERIANTERNRLEQNEMNLAIKEIQHKPTPSISENESPSSSEEEDDEEESELPNTKTISRKTNKNNELQSPVKAKQPLAVNITFWHRTTIKK